jgi:peptide/nickel transport system substrate-binding protein
MPFYGEGSTLSGMNSTSAFPFFSVCGKFLLLIKRRKEIGRSGIGAKKKEEGPMKKRMPLIIIVCCIVALLGLSGGALAAPKGKVVIAQGGEDRTVDAHKGGSTMSINFGMAVYDLLAKRNDEGKVELSLATSYKTIDPTTWEFKLRQGVRFHNGDPLTAKDVKFSLDRLRAPETKSPNQVFYAGIKEVQVIDDTTVRILTDQPDPTLLDRLTQVAFVVPEAYIKKNGDEYFGKNPIGSGRYKFVKWVQNDYIELEANENYWGQEPASVKTLILKVIPENGARMAALQTGEVDIATNIPPFMVPSLSKSQDIKVISGPSGRVIFIGMNLLKADKAGPLMKKEVRQALNYAVDKKSLIKNILMGSGEELATPLVPGMFGFDPAIQPYPYDPEKAKKLLAEAGFPNGFETEFDTGSGRYLMDKQVAEAVVGMLAKVGVKVKLNVLEWGKYTDVRRAHTVAPLYLLGWAQTIYDADGTLGPLFCIDCTHSNYHNSALVKMMDEARYEMNAEKRKALYRQILTLIKDEAPWIFLYQQVDHYGIRKRIGNFNKLAGSELMYFDTLKITE